MIGGFSTPKKDKKIKVSSGESVKTGKILLKGISAYKAGKNVQGKGTLMALCDGKVHFSRKKTSNGRVRTFINVLPSPQK